MMKAINITDFSKEKLQLMIEIRLIHHNYLKLRAAKYKFYINKYNFYYIKSYDLKIEISNNNYFRFNEDLKKFNWAKNCGSDIVSFKSKSDLINAIWDIVRYSRLSLFE